MSYNLPGLSGVPGPSGTQGPRNTPNTGTPRNNSPSQGAQDAESGWYGKVKAWDPAGQYVKIEFSRGAPTGNPDEPSRYFDTEPRGPPRSDDILELRGQEARDAVRTAGPWRPDLDVMVKFVGLTRKVKDVRRWAGGPLIPNRLT